MKRFSSLYMEDGPLAVDVVHTLKVLAGHSIPSRFHDMQGMTRTQ